MLENEVFKVSGATFAELEQANRWDYTQKEIATIIDKIIIDNHLNLDTIICHLL